jgi:aryl-alcohol dehydrogenase-like predicted oxidoreductase
LSPQPQTGSIAVRHPAWTVAGKPIPKIVLGTARLGSVLPDALVSTGDRMRALRYLDGILEAGCPAFDLAASYQLGGTERLFGSWIRSRRNRDELFLITKAGHPYPVVRPHRLTPAAIRNDLHASLRRLGAERVDLFLLHKDDPGAPLEPILESLATHERAGKFGAWGVSNWTHERVRALDGLVGAAGLSRPSASSPHFSLVEWTNAPWKGSASLSGDANREARAFYERTRLPVLAWSPLGSGFFSKPGESIDSDARRTYGTAANFARKRRAEDLGRRYHMTAAQVALAYVLHQRFPVFAVVSMSSPERLRSNLEASALPLSESEARWLESGEGPLPF